MNLRTFKKYTIFDLRINIPGFDNIVKRISFLDILEDGSLDLFAQLPTENNSGRYLTITPIFNNNDYDAFFLSVTVLHRWNSVKLLNNTEYVGACVTVFVYELSGQLVPKTGTQMSQSGVVMQMPVIRFGLGRTNNYLQTLTVTVPRNENETRLSRMQKSPIIPNSDILIVAPFA